MIAIVSRREVPSFHDNIRANGPIRPPLMGSAGERTEAVNGGERVGTLSFVVLLGDDDAAGNCADRNGVPSLRGILDRCAKEIAGVFEILRMVRSISGREQNNFGIGRARSQQQPYR
jgi:hypothetical protein